MNCKKGIKMTKRPQGTVRLWLSIMSLMSLSFYHPSSPVLSLSIVSKPAFVETVGPEDVDVSVAAHVLATSYLLSH